MRIAWLAVLMAGCGAGAATAGQGGGPTEMPPAKADAAVAEAPPAPADEVHGTVFQNTTTHCGGATPRADEPMSTRVPSGGRKLYVRRGGENSASEVVAQVVSDADGGFVLKLPAGTYCVIDDAKLTFPEPSSPAPRDAYTDPGCLENWRRKCEATFTMPSSSPLVIELWHTCFGPCYHGPLPP